MFNFLTKPKSSSGSLKAFNKDINSRNASPNTTPKKAKINVGYGKKQAQ